MTYEYEDKLEFIKNLYCPARVVADETGASWELILSQAAQETLWGEKILPGTNNIFNIKADPSWEGESKMFNVHEIVNGSKIWVDAPFRVYPTILDSLRDRMAFLKDNPRYGKAGLFDADTKGNLEKEAAALQKAGYATDPNYATSLKTVFDGKTMQRAVKEAQKQGCGPILPVIEVIVLDGAKVPIAKAKVNATQNGKSAEISTDAAGRIIIRITPNSGDIQLKIFDAVKNSWIDLDPVKIPSPIKSTTITLISPTFTVQTSTRTHEKVAAKAEAPKKTPEAGKSKDASNNFEMHTIEKGESLSSISKKYSVRYKTIADANNIASPYIIRPGQVLKIPKIDGGQNHTNQASPATASKANEGSHQTDASGNGDYMAMFGKMFSDSQNYLHTIFYRNEKDNPQTDVMHSSKAPWMKFAQEEFEKGVKRHVGKGPSDPRILEYFKATPTLDKASAATDKTPYCAAFANWCLVKAGFKGDNSALAASFAKWGRPTKGNKPGLGAVAVIKFPEGGHHVTFVAGLSANGKMIATLGGNQGKGHEVSHSHVTTAWVVAYRYPSDYPDHDDDYVLTDVKGDHATMSAKSTH